MRTNSASSTFITLSPRQQLTPVPDAIFAGSAGSALTAATATMASEVGANSVAAAAIQTNAVTSASIVSGQVVKSLTAGVSTLYDHVTLAAGNNVTITPSGQTLTIAAAAGGSGSGWSLTGNAGPTPGPNYSGTSDDQNSPFTSKVSNQFLIRAQNGVVINTNDTAGFALNVNGIVCLNGVEYSSDRNVKENFQSLDGQMVLAKVAALPLTEWNYKSGAATIRHIGPMAQDFHAAFNLNGSDDTHISVVDEGGVALAAIQGLNQKLERQNQEKDTQIQKLQQSVAQLTQLVNTRLEKK